MLRGRGTRWLRTFPVNIWNSHRAYAAQGDPLTVDGSSITIASLETSFRHKWLRDACQCVQCVHPTTQQKLHNTADLPADTSPVESGVSLTNDGLYLQVEWKGGHRSFYPLAFLRAHSSPQRLARFHGDIDSKAWDLAAISRSPHLFTPYASLKEPSGLLAAITQLTQYGLLFVSDIPNAHVSPETCELRVLASYFGEIRETFYGRLFDVKNIREGTNIAYTNLDLGLHMDLLYFQHPPRYQILHCLRNRVVGGASVFVDALHVAEELRRTRPAEFETLAETPVSFQYINDGHHLHHEHRTIELSTVHPADPHRLPIAYVNYSPPFMAPLPVETPSTFYDAFKTFTSMLRRQQNTYIYTLREGDAVLFDNRRVLHARTSFTDSEEGSSADGEPNRLLKGCYLEADALLDRGRVLRRKWHVQNT